PRARSRLCAPVGILEAHDIVFAEIAADLHLYEFERRVSRVGDAMFCADGNEYGLVLAPQLGLVVHPHERRAADNHPVFRPMVMQLKRELSARVDHDSLDPESVALRNRLIAAPRPLAPGTLLNLEPAATAQA